MRESEKHLNNLVLSVVHLSTRTRDLATSRSFAHMELVPLREAVHVVSCTLQAMEAALADESAAAEPENPTPGPTGDNWLVDPSPED